MWGGGGGVGVGGGAKWKWAVPERPEALMEVNGQSVLLLHPFSKVTAIRVKSVAHKLYHKPATGRQD